MNKLSIITGSASAIVGVLMAYNWDEMNWFEKFGSGLAIVVILIGFVKSLIDSNKEKKKERADAKYGELNKTKKVSVPTVAIGHSEAIFAFVSGEGELSCPGGSLMRVGVLDGKLIINAVIRNSNGVAIAVIDNSTWTYYNSAYEYNDDNKTAFELVTHGDRKVYFQIFLRNNIAHVSGWLLTAEGVGWVLSGVANGGIMQVINPMGKQPDIPVTIPRIFKYPREKHYGVREKLTTQ